MTRRQQDVDDLVQETLPKAIANMHRYQNGTNLRAVVRLPEHYRSTLILVVMLGESYDTTAEICGVAVGTAKSRVNRARAMVLEELGEQEEMIRL